MYASMSDIARARQEGGRDRKERGRTVGNALFLREILCGTNRFLYYYVRYTARSLTTQCSVIVHFYCKLPPNIAMLRSYLPTR